MTRVNSTRAGLYTDTGQRKYLNRAERTRALAAAGHLSRDRMLFCLTLAWTGARISEVLALTPARFQLNECVVSFQTLKRRKLHMREVPVPPFLIQALEGHYRLRELQADKELSGELLWAFHRVTAWRVIKKIMIEVGLRGA